MCLCLKFLNHVSIEYIELKCNWLTFYSPYSFASPVFTGFTVCFVVYEPIIAGGSYMGGYVKTF